MKQLMMGFVSLLFCSVFVLPPVQAQEKSDYEVIQSFKQKLAEIKDEIQRASTVQECVDISQRIDDLEKEYADNVKLLDQYLYPNGYKGSIANVRMDLKLSQEKLGIIETQFTRITELEGEVKALTGKVDSLTGQNADLLAQINRMGEEAKGMEAGAASAKAVIDSLKNVINKLRKNIKDRDQMIFALVDSLFMQYDKSVASMKDVEKQSLSGRLARRNVFTNMKKAIQDNIQFLQTTELSSKDLVDMINEQRRFALQWKAFGAKLQGLYAPGKKGANEMKDVQNMLDEWGQKVDASFWQGLNLAFQEHGLAVKPFNSGSEFKTNLLGFIDEQIKDAQSGKKEKSYKAYVAFYDSLWQMQLKPSWIPLLVDSGKISDADRKEIETDVANWGNAVSPSRIWIYILILAVLLVAAYFFFFFRKKTPAQPPPAQPNP
jgi:hypothetical protein